MALVKLHSLTSSSGLALNGATGRLGQWCENFNGQAGNNRYEVWVGSPPRLYMIKVENTYAVNPRWITEVRATPFRNRMDDMTSKFNAPGIYPCPISDLQVLPRHRGGRGTDRRLIESWWGDKVFLYIRERMEQQKMRKGTANWEMYNAIEKGTLMLAGVRSDGGHEMQESPEATRCSGFVFVWPTIAYPSDDNSTWYSYCQGLALQDNASPWICSPDALEFYGPWQYIVDPIDISQFPSSVIIEELESDTEMESESFEMVRNYGVEEIYDF